MSTLTVTNIKATGETASRAVSGVAGALARFDGTAGTLSLDTSQNVSSLTDTATGRPQVNFTNAFSTANFHTTAIAQARCIYGTQSVAASSVLMRYGDYQGTDQDRIHCSVTVHGDLA
jgi:hypothetical protein